MSDYKPHQNLPDLDEEETDEWLESLRTVFDEHGSERARMLLHELMIEAELLSIPIHKISRTPYLNSIPINQQIPYPGNLELENILNIFSENIIRALKTGGSVEIRGFGRWFPKIFKENFNARNPATNELIYKPERLKIRFKPAKKLKKIINE